MSKEQKHDNFLHPPPTQSLRVGDEPLQSVAQTRAGTKKWGCLLDRSQLFD